VKDYLSAIHGRLDQEWNKGVRAMAAALLPPGHPANRRDRMAEIEIRLDWLGQPTGTRVSRPSGYKPYDDSALRVMSQVTLLPPLPGSIREGHPTLYWRFHRDERGCSPLFARLDLRPLATEESMRRALARGRLDQATRILRDHRGQPSLLAIVAEAGLASDDPAARKLSLEVASSDLLAAVLDHEKSDEIWNEAVQTLAARKDSGRLVRLLDGLVQTPAKPAPGKTRVETRKLIHVLRALSQLDAHLTDGILRSLLASQEPEVVLATMALVASPALLDEPPLKAWNSRAAVQGPLAVKKCHLGPDPAAEKIIRAVLGDRDAVATLETLMRFPVPAVNDEIEALPRKKTAPLAVRVKAIEAIAALKLSIIPLYQSLRDAAAPEVQTAAARALGQSTGNKLALSHRLADLAQRSRGQVAAEALAALARVGDERFRLDTLRRMKLLDGKGQALVAGSLFGFGEEAVPTLSRLLEHRSPEVRAAARSSLARVPGEKAKSALAAAAKEPESAARLSPLEELLREAASYVRAAPGG
jgi:TonB family protein